MGDVGSPTWENEHLLIVLFFDEPPTQLIEDIKRTFPGIKVTYFFQPRDPANDLVLGCQVPKELLLPVTILVTLVSLPKPEDVPNLKLVHIISSGLDHIVNHPIVTDTDIPITSVSGIHGPPIAEWTVMNWMVAARHYNTTYEWQKERNWAPKAFHFSISDHVGKKLGVLGYGSIGRQIGRVASALGMTVHAYTASPRRTPESKRDAGYIVPHTGDPDGTIPVSWHSGSSKEDLHAFLAQGLDHLVVSVPLTPATTHLLGAAEFKVLSGSRTGRKTFLTNISRGKILDQAALIASLEKDELSGAALDVADPEPLPKESPLWDAPNVIISPHVSSLGVEYLGRAFDVLKVNLKRRERGEKMFNLLRRKEGYASL